MSSRNLVAGLVLATFGALACSHSRPAASAQSATSRPAASASSATSRPAPSTAARSASSGTGSLPFVPASAASGYNPAMTPASRSAPSLPGQLGAEAWEPLDDAQTATILRALSAIEIDEAQIALRRAENDAVKRFADRVIAEDSRALSDMDVLTGRLGLAPAQSQLVQELRRKAKSVSNKLSSAGKTGFDEIYMLTQIDMHRVALDTIDTRLSPTVTHDELRQLLVGTRARMAAQMETAREIEQQLS